MILRSLLIVLLMAISDIIRTISCYGSMIFQCPAGHYISMFNTAYVGSERYYKFSCSKFNNINTVMSEKCSVSEVISSEIDDIYLSCGNYQYSVGVEVIEDVSGEASSWQLLCCSSESIKIRLRDCIETKFLNDINQSSTFSTGNQIIRRWQALIIDRDLRWWLQLCPVDIRHETEWTESPVRTVSRKRRQIPIEWSLGRFPPQDISVLHNKLISMSYPDTQFTAIIMDITHNISLTVSYFLVPINDNLIEQRHRLQNYGRKSQTKVFRRIPPAQPATISDDHKEESETIVSEEISNEPMLTSSTATAKTPTTTTTTVTASTTPAAEDGAIDYYDVFDENFSKEKHKLKHSILGRVSDLLQNIQDGLLFAQAALPTDRSVRTTTEEGPAFLLSRDDDSLTIDMKQSRKSSNDHPMFSSIFKVKRFGPKPATPESGSNVQRSSASTASTAFTLTDSNALQKMFQFFGLCNGHEL